MGYPAIDKRMVRYQFGRAAPTYDEASHVQRQMAERLCTLAETVPGRDIIDLGCGTGYLLARLEQQSIIGEPSMLVGIDISSRMLGVARRRLRRCLLLLADMESVPMGDNSFDCILSNAAIQWCDLGAVASEMRRILRPGGRLLLGTFGPATLREWKIPVAGTLLSTTQLPAAGIIEEKLERSGFKDISISSELTTLEYRNTDDMFKAIKDLGATFANMDRQRGLMGKSRYARIRSAFDEQLNTNGVLSLTFEPMLVTAKG